MTEEQIKQNIAKNIIDLRKRNGMTQSELADALNYSDKSVSKWERAEGTPDVFVLYKIAELFNISLDDIIGVDLKPTDEISGSGASKKAIIPLLSTALVFFISSLIFLVIKLAIPAFTRAWLVFVFAVPVSAISLIVFTSLWWGLKWRFASISLLIWSLSISVYLTFKTPVLSVIFIAAGIFQLIVILWFIMLHFSKKKQSQK